MRTHHLTGSEMTYSIDLRQRVAGFVEAGGRKAEASRRYEVSLWCVTDWCKRADLRPKAQGRRHRKLDWEALRQHIEAQATRVPFPSRRRRHIDTRARHGGAALDHGTRRERRPQLHTNRIRLPKTPAGLGLMPGPVGGHVHFRRDHGRARDTRVFNSGNKSGFLL